MPGGTAWIVSVGGALVLAVGCSSNESAAPETTQPAVAPPTTTVEPTTSETTEGEGATTVESDPPPDLTHAQFIARLDRICRRGNRQIDRYSRRIDAAFAREDYSEAARIWQRAKKRLDAPFYRAVEALAVPPGDVQGLNRYLAFSRQIDVLETRYIRALRQADEEEMTRLNGLIDRLANNRTLATSRMGLTECGS